MNKTQILSVLIVCVFTFSLSGCSGNPGGSVTADAGQEAIDSYQQQQAEIERESLEELSDLKY